MSNAPERKLPPEERMRRADRAYEEALLDMRAEYEAAQRATEAMRQEIIHAEFRFRALRLRAERSTRPRHLQPRESTGPRAKLSS